MSIYISCKTLTECSKSSQCNGRILWCEFKQRTNVCHCLEQDQKITADTDCIPVTILTLCIFSNYTNHTNILVLQQYCSRVICDGTIPDSKDINRSISHYRPECSITIKYAEL